MALAHGIVGTVGRLQVEPGAPNVIPGRVTLDLEMRGMDATVLDIAEAELAALAQRGGGDFAHGLAKPATPASPPIMAAIATASDALGLLHRAMPSGAGHDAMNMAQLCPYGMILYPVWVASAMRRKSTLRRRTVLTVGVCCWRRWPRWTSN